MWCRNWQPRHVDAVEPAGNVVSLRWNNNLYRTLNTQLRSVMSPSREKVSKFFRETYVCMKICQNKQKKTFTPLIYILLSCVLTLAQMFLQNVLLDIAFHSASSHYNFGGSRRKSPNETERNLSSTLKHFLALEHLCLSRAGRFSSAFVFTKQWKQQSWWSDSSRGRNKTYSSVCLWADNRLIIYEPLD